MIGAGNLASAMAPGASTAYARNVTALVDPPDPATASRRSTSPTRSSGRRAASTHDGEVAARRSRSGTDEPDLVVDLTIFVLSLLVGFEVISKVPATLHTPLMSGANSIHGIVVVGAMLIAATAHGWVGYLLAFVAMAFATAERGRRVRR